MKNNADIWSKLPSWMQDAIDKFIEYNDQAEELEEKLNQNLFQTTSKGIEDAILNGLKGGKKGIEDFGEDFEEIMRNALLQSFVIEQLRGKAQEFYKKYTQLADSDGDKKLDLTEDEIKELRDDWNAIVSAASAEKDKIDQITGGSSSSSQSSTKGGFAAMSQDTGEELNGRFTALQISNEEIKNSMLSMLTGVNLISTTTSANGITLMEIRNIALMSNSHLEDIARFTKPLLEVGGKLDRIESNTKGLTSR